MPILPVILGTDPNSDLAVRDAADVLAAMPARYRRAKSAPLRDAAAAAFVAICFEWQRQGARAASLSDIARSVGRYLEGLVDDRGQHRIENEEDEALRARALAVPSLVSRTAILAIANTILATYTPIKPRVFESILDRTYLFDSPGPVGTCRSFLGASPYYPDRLYPDDASENFDLVRVQSDPPEAFIFGDQVGRCFVLLVPDITPIDDARVFLFDSATEAADDGRAFLGDGANVAGSEMDGSVASFPTSSINSALDAYQSIVDAVELVIGHGIRWTLLSDPSLT